MNSKLLLCFSLFSYSRASRIRLLNNLESPTSTISEHSLGDLTTTTTSKELLPPAPTELKNAALEAHNKRRQLHKSPLLKWCETCYEEAKRQANACQRAGKLFPGHLGVDNDEGQNLYAVSLDLAPYGTYEEAVEAAVTAWYGEAVNRKYDYSVNRLQRGTGQFSQLIWRDTTTMGMAISDNGRFIVANYYPRGNVPRKIQENVGPIQLEYATATTTTSSHDPPKVALKGTIKVKQLQLAYALNAVLASRNSPSCAELQQVFKTIDHQRNDKVFMKQVEKMLDDLDVGQKVESLQLLKDVYAKVGKDPETEAIKFKDWVVFKNAKDCELEYSWSL